MTTTIYQRPPPVTCQSCRFHPKNCGYLELCKREHRKPLPAHNCKDWETKEPWQMTFDEFVQSESTREGGIAIHFGRNTARDHEQLVRQALSEGKPVSPEVLADYPDPQPGAGADLAAQRR